MKLKDLILLILHVNDNEPVTSIEHLKHIVFLCEKALGVAIEK